MTVAIRTQAELYDNYNGILKVTYSLPNYTLNIGNTSIRLDPKTLESLSMAEPLDFVKQMRQIKPSINAVLKKEGLSMSEVQLALAQASLTDQKYKEQDRARESADF